MMIILEIIILLIGLIISIMTLQDINKSQKLKRWLSSSYILLCLISIGILFAKKAEEKKDKFELFHSLDKIESSVNTQNDSMQSVLNKTTKINNTIDSIEKRAGVCSTIKDEQFYLKLIDNYFDIDKRRIENWKIVKKSVQSNPSTAHEINDKTTPIEYLTTRINQPNPYMELNMPY
jgi:hypothetical protein